MSPALATREQAVFARVAGHAAIDLSGAASVLIVQAGAAQAGIDRLTLGLSGAGSVAVSQGRIDRVDVDESGAGTVRVGATVGDAAVQVSGFGTVRVATLTGRLTRKVSGAGSVVVGGAAAGGRPD